MNHLLDRLMKARTEIREDILEAVAFIRQQGWKVQDAQNRYWEIAILNDAAMRVVLGEDDIPDIGNAVYSRVTIELKKVAMEKRVLVGPAQLELALDLCTSPQTKDFSVSSSSSAWIPHPLGWGGNAAFLC